MMTFPARCSEHACWVTPSLGRLMDRATSRLQDSLRTQSEQSLAPGMHFPVDWEPYFNDSMTLLGIDHHPTQHYDHHRQQLTLAFARGR